MVLFGGQPPLESPLGCGLFGGERGAGFFDESDGDSVGTPNQMAAPDVAAKPLCGDYGRFGHADDFGQRRDSEKPAALVHDPARFQVADLIAPIRFISA